MSRRFESRNNHQGFLVVRVCLSLTCTVPHESLMSHVRLRKMDFPLEGGNAFNNND